MAENARRERWCERKREWKRSFAGALDDDLMSVVGAARLLNTCGELPLFTDHSGSVLFGGSESMGASRATGRVVTGDLTISGVLTPASALAPPAVQPRGAQSAACHHLASSLLPCRSPSTVSPSILAPKMNLTDLAPPIAPGARWSMLLPLTATSLIRFASIADRERDRLPHLGLQVIATYSRWPYWTSPPRVQVIVPYYCSLCKWPLSALRARAPRGRGRYLAGQSRWWHD